MNHEWRVARRWFVTATVLIAIIAAVPFVGPDGMDGGFAIQFLAFFGVVVCLVAGGVYAGRARVLDRLLRGDGVLVDWEYAPGVYPAYADVDLAEDRATGRGMLGIIACFCVLFGGLIWWADPDAGPFVALILCGVLAVCWFAMMWNTTWRSRRLRGRWLTRAVVSAEGVYLEPWVYEWHTPGNRLESVDLQFGAEPDSPGRARTRAASHEPSSVPQGSGDVALVFGVRTKVPGAAPSTHVVRVPVPIGGLEDARRVVAALGQTRDR